MFFSWFVVAFVMATAATLVKARTESGEGTLASPILMTSISPGFLCRNMVPNGTRTLARLVHVTSSKLPL